MSPRFMRAVAATVLSVPIILVFAAVYGVRVDWGFVIGFLLGQFLFQLRCP